MQQRVPMARDKSAWISLTMNGFSTNTLGFSFCCFTATFSVWLAGLRKLPEKKQSMPVGAFLKCEPFSTVESDPLCQKTILFCESDLQLCTLQSLSTSLTWKKLLEILNKPLHAYANTGLLKIHYISKSFSTCSILRCCISEIRHYIRVGVCLTWLHKRRRVKQSQRSGSWCT